MTRVLYLLRAVPIAIFVVALVPAGFVAGLAFTGFMVGFGLSADYADAVTKRKKARLDNTGNQERDR